MGAFAKYFLGGIVSLIVLLAARDFAPPGYFGAIYVIVFALTVSTAFNAGRASRDAGTRRETE
jgi:hypothetical protein